MLYLIADMWVGLVWMLITIPTLVFIQGMYRTGKDDDYFGMSQFNFFLAIQVFCWLTQFVGHNVFEKRAPAITDNLFFMFLAPFFEIFEILHRLFGYKQGPRMHKIQELIQREISEFHASKRHDNVKAA